MWIRLDCAEEAKNWAGLKAKEERPLFVIGHEVEYDASDPFVPPGVLSEPL